MKQRLQVAKRKHSSDCSNTITWENLTSSWAGLAHLWWISSPSAFDSNVANPPLPSRASRGVWSYLASNMLVRIALDLSSQTCFLFKIPWWIIWIEILGFDDQSMMRIWRKKWFPSQVLNSLTRSFHLNSFLPFSGWNWFSKRENDNVKTFLHQSRHEVHIHNDWNNFKSARHRTRASSLVP